MTAACQLAAFECYVFILAESFLLDPLTVSCGSFRNLKVSLESEILIFTIREINVSYDIFQGAATVMINFIDYCDSFPGVNPVRRRIKLNLY